MINSRLISLILIFLFFILYFLQLSGYSEYKQNARNVLTNQEIKLYEKDILDGKDVSIKDYLKNKSINYENKISKLGLDLSYLIEKIFNNGMNSFFKMLNETINS